MIASWLRRLDGVLYRHPFEGSSARRYAAAERPAFGDLDDRLLDALAPALDGARALLDVGAGPATFAARAAARHPALPVIAVDPSRDFARRHDIARRHPGVTFARAVGAPGMSIARAAGEALPLGDGAVDVAICLSSIRHVRDRDATLRELRRVVRHGGTCWIVELDPAASARRIANHADRLGSPLLRAAFGPLVVRTAPTAAAIETRAITAGWQRRALRDDPVQPVYILELA